MRSPNDRPIFVVGCPRSGTTLLQLMLHRHPRIAIPPETRFLIPAYESRAEFGDLADPANRERLARWIVGRRRTRFDDLGLDAEEVVEEIVAGPGTLGSALGIVFRAYSRRFGKDRWGDKRPGYFQNIPVLVRLFPDAQIVHLIRDGRDCVASLKEMPWYKQDSYHALATWIEAVRAGRRAARVLGPDSYHEIRYEDLIADPEARLTGLCRFLDVEYHEEMAEPSGVASEAVPSRKSWHHRTHEKVSASRSGTWEQRLEPWEIALCEAEAGPYLRSLGYEPSEARRPSAAERARFRSVATRRTLAARKRHLRDRWQRLHEPSPVAALLTSGQREAVERD
ncbi:sulfotransferase family protein [Thermomonospora umbrina]|uniref:Sulfotransferase family protein n=1 Tax=Thermomonospora umbrina TaxID=111806 RepID=A0A3D9SXA3_9ACTN|nr:sulfotransferase [Thermomonospora umbrina]REF00198.1 sulfotransferase family protein [Thermomonospora umbrina]